MASQSLRPRTKTSSLLAQSLYGTRSRCYLHASGLRIHVPTEHIAVVHLLGVERHLVSYDTMSRGRLGTEPNSVSCMLVAQCDRAATCSPLPFTSRGSSSGLRILHSVVLRWYVVDECVTPHRNPLAVNRVDIYSLYEYHLKGFG